MPEVRAALVTGATSGIGRAAALELAQDGFRSSSAAATPRAEARLADPRLSRLARHAGRADQHHHPRTGQHWRFIEGSLTALGRTTLLARTAEAEEIGDVIAVIPSRRRTHRRLTPHHTYIYWS